MVTAALREDAWQYWSNRENHARMESGGKRIELEAVWRDAEIGPRRMYYRLTNKGKKAMTVEKKLWMRIHNALVELWGPALPSYTGR